MVPRASSKGWGRGTRMLFMLFLPRRVSYMLDPEKERERKRLAWKRWKAHDPHRAIDAQRRVRQKLRRKVLLRLGSSCVRCGFDDERALQVDHINGGGRQETIRLKNKPSFYRKVLRDPSG